MKQERGEMKKERGEHLTDIADLEATADTLRAEKNTWQQPAETFEFERNELQATADTPNTEEATTE